MIFSRKSIELNVFMFRKINPEMTPGFWYGNVPATVKGTKDDQKHEDSSLSFRHHRFCLFQHVFLLFFFCQLIQFGIQNPHTQSVSYTHLRAHETVLDL